MAPAGPRRTIPGSGIPAGAVLPHTSTPGTTDLRLTNRSSPEAPGVLHVHVEDAACDRLDRIKTRLMQPGVMSHGYRIELDAEDPFCRPCRKPACQGHSWPGWGCSRSINGRDFDGEKQDRHYRSGPSPTAIPPSACGSPAVGTARPGPDRSGGVASKASRWSAGRSPGHHSPDTAPKTVDRDPTPTTQDLAALAVA